MSLVAYASSSDEESEQEDENQVQSVKVATPSLTKLTLQPKLPANGHISDEDDDYTPIEQSLSELRVPSSTRFTLPAPKNASLTKSDEEPKLENETSTPDFVKLPMPKAAATVKAIIEEADDEFLHKKATALKNVEIAKPPPPPAAVSRVPVKISIPSMKDFSDVDEEIAKSGNKKSTQAKTGNKSSLLAILPQAKSEQNFAKSTTPKSSGGAPQPSKNSSMSSSHSLIPDTVRNRRPAHNTEGVDGIKASSSNSKKPLPQQKLQSKIALVDCSDSEVSDDEIGDFFSLSNNEKLPEVNVNEINVMVAKRAAKMAEVTTKYLTSTTTNEEVVADDSNQQEENEIQQARKRYNEQQLNEEALQALVGGSAKRRRQQASSNVVDVIDISSREVLPDRDEWMRTALTSSTAYQPTGVLVDEEPAAGTRRKHQITYLAHKAKANEAELQAMWAANRQNRRATQSKYGF